MNEPPEQAGNNVEHGTKFYEISDEDLFNAVQVAPLPAFVLNGSRACSISNSAFCTFAGYTSGELMGKNAAEFIVTEGVFQGGERTFPNGGAYPDVEFIAKDKTSVWGEVFSQFLSGGRVLIFVSDLTERRRKERAFHEAERKRWQSDRIEALGRLAGGIAHDFNNYLAVILLHVDIMNLHLPEDSPVRTRVKEIKEVTDSVSATVRELLAFGRKQQMTLLPIGLNQTVTAFAENFRSFAGNDVNIELKLAPDLGICFVDQTRITQVIMNLAVNAKEAMPSGGTLRIETSNIVLDKAEPTTVQPSGPYVEVLIADDGAGMDPITLDHIFEPFFSTKESDKGAGMSLAMVYGIIKQSKGFIWVESELGKGTTFRLQFPRVDQTAIAPAEVGRAVENNLTKTVLLVDDEEPVRRITAEFLKMSGYGILQAAGALEALEIAQDHSEPINLLITDFFMPQMNGMELARKIRNLRPEASVLFMSGNLESIEEIIYQEQVSGEKNNFIGKPFSSADFTEKVREILGG